MKTGEKILIISTSVLVVGVLTFLFIYNARKKNRRTIHDIINELPKSKTCTSSNRDFDAVDTIVVHQTDSKCKGDQHPFDTANNHIHGNGWCGIGYHMFITEAGKIFQTRSLKKETPHAGSRNNPTSIGVVICGTHRLKDAQQNEEIIPTEQYKALVWTLAYLQKTYPRLTRIVSHDSLSSHRSDPNLHMSELLRDVKKTRV